MNRQFYLDCARQGLRMPIGADLVLREKSDHAARLLDGRGLGEVIIEAAGRYNTPLAFPLMDLTIEKHDLLTALGIAEADIEQFHFSTDPGAEALDRATAGFHQAPAGRMKASLDAISTVARQSDLLPVGMAIGPFSLMTKLLSDPITPVFMAGAGVTGAEDMDVMMVERCLALATWVIERSLRLQAQAGAKAICICEPAANQVYISPNQLAAGSDVFERLVMAPNRHLRKVLRECETDLIFHDCGELVPDMVKQFVTLDPAILSLGSSRKLWEDAPLIPESTVIYGNLPTKKFYSDQEMSLSRVETLTRELITHMRRTGHPFIVGSECDVLSVPGSEQTIKAKIHCMLTCGCGSV